jgi:acyl-CoA thioester hydrolase
MAFIKTFDIRWSDLDANRHVANISYSIFAIETRMSYFASQGFDQKAFERHQIGPVILAEHFYYLKEVLPAQKVHVDFELAGNTDDFSFCKITNSIFNHKGELAVFNEGLIAWFDLKERKIRTPPPDLLAGLHNMAKTDNYAIFDKKETRSAHIPKKNLDL